ncbi:hypothetical protein G9A89_013917 [Geosiphon pyriformis]|nr:hypothetical protein G9A89_013917 [Geosiphon pyriformis]
MSQREDKKKSTVDCLKPLVRKAPKKQEPLTDRFNEKTKNVRQPAKPGSSKDFDLKKRYYQLLESFKNGSDSIPATYDKTLEYLPGKIIPQQSTFFKKLLAEPRKDPEQVRERREITKKYIEKHKDLFDHLNVPLPHPEKKDFEECLGFELASVSKNKAQASSSNQHQNVTNNHNGTMNHNTNNGNSIQSAASKSKGKNRSGSMPIRSQTTADTSTTKSIITGPNKFTPGSTSESAVKSTTTNKIVTKPTTITNISTSTIKSTTANKSTIKPATTSTGTSKSSRPSKSSLTATPITGPAPSVKRIKIVSSSVLAVPSIEARSELMKEKKRKNDDNEEGRQKKKRKEGKEHGQREEFQEHKKDKEHRKSKGTNVNAPNTDLESCKTKRRTDIPRVKIITSNMERD